MLKKHLIATTVLTFSIFIGLAQAHAPIKLWAMDGQLFRSTHKTAFASNEKLKVGANGQVKIHCYVTNFNIPNDPLSNIQLQGYNGSGDLVGELFLVTKNGEYMTENEYATLNWVFVRGDFHVEFQQNPPRALVEELP